MHSRTTLLVLLGSLAICLTAQAQLSALDSARLRQKLHPGVAFKLLPSASFDVNATYQIAAEIFLKDGKHSVQPELGYGTYESTLRMFESPNFKGQEVWRARLEWRSYQEAFLRKDHENTYWGIDVFFKNVNTPVEAEIGRQCDAGNCAYFENIRYLDQKTVLGIHGKYGFQWVASSRIVIDFYGGGGLRFIKIGRRGYPSDAQNFDDFRGGFSFRRNVGNYFGPSALLGVRVGYLLERKKQ